jgi:hypothetical protein
MNVQFASLILPTLLVSAGLTVLAALVSFIRPTPEEPFVRHGKFSWLLYLGFVASVVILAGSSFWSIFESGHMKHYALLAHVSAAGAFVFLMLAVALVYLPRGRQYRQVWWGRWSAWGLITCGCLASMTMFASMLPVLDTTGLLNAAEIHRFAGLATTALTIVHAASLVVERLR